MYSQCAILGNVADWASIWLIDISRQLQSAQLDGFDISAGQYPPQEWLPNNISLTSLDIYEDIPESLQGKYDIVHVRLFLAVVRKSDPGPILDRLRRMLSPSCSPNCRPVIFVLGLLIHLLAWAEPGGYLQWSEHNCATASVECARDVRKTDDLQFFIDCTKDMTTRSVANLITSHRIISQLWEKFTMLMKEMMSSWPSTLSQSFKNEGFEDVTTYRYPIGPEMRGYFTQAHLMVMEEVSYFAMDNSDPEAGGCEQRRRILEAAKQIDEGAAIHFNLEVTVGRNAG